MKSEWLLVLLTPPPTHPPVRQCEQPLQCEVNHMLGLDPVRYDLTGWFGLIQNNPSSLNAATLLQNSTVYVTPAGCLGGASVKLLVL